MQPSEGGISRTSRSMSEPPWPSNNGFAVYRSIGEGLPERHSSVRDRANCENSKGLTGELSTCQDPLQLRYFRSARTPDKNNSFGWRQAAKAGRNSKGPQDAIYSRLRSKSVNASMAMRC